jgi:hypothetical protein
MAEDYFSPDEFHFYFPLWTLADPQLGDTMPECTRAAMATDLGLCLMIFTDLDLAERFIASMRKSQVRPVVMRHPQELIAVGEHQQRKGATHVGIDISFHPKPEGGFNRSGGRYADIAPFIEGVRRDWKAGGDDPEGPQG